MAIAGKAFRLNLKPLRGFIRSLRAKPLPPTVSKQWVVRYSAFARKRFKKEGASEGETKWRQRALATLKARRKGRRTAGSPKILQDKGLLLGGLTVGASGNLVKPIRGGVRFGFGGPAKHGKGKATIADIARFHQKGGRRLPQRKIIVDPDSKTIKGMQKDYRTFIGKLGKRHERRM